MFGIGTGEVLLVAFIIFLIYGPDEFPKMFRKAGKMVSDLQRTTQQVKHNISTEMQRLEYEEEQKNMPAVSTPEQVIEKVTTEPTPYVVSMKDEVNHDESTPL